MEDFLPVIGFIIYVFLQVSGVLGKKKKPELVGEEEYPQEPKKTFLEQLEDLEKRIGDTIEPQEVVEPTKKTQEYQPLSDEVNRPTYQPISLEITEAPYSNLEEGIIDDVHRSKFPHHQKASTLLKKEQKQPIELFQKISKKEAFIYSEVFKRKYFQVD